MNEIFQKYHIPGLRSIVRSKCMQCKLRDEQPNVPEMAALPTARLSAFTKPFSYIGVDFFGAFLVTAGRKTEKRYGTVLSCLTVRAVHIEMVYILDMNSCDMAIRNFIARRGVPLEILRDNRTNLTAAEKELREFVGPETKWTFILEAIPHMGASFH